MRHIMHAIAEDLMRWVSLGHPLSLWYLGLVNEITVRINDEKWEHAPLHYGTDPIPLSSDKLGPAESIKWHSTMWSCRGLHTCWEGTRFSRTPEASKQDKDGRYYLGGIDIISIGTMDQCFDNTRWVIVTGKGSFNVYIARNGFVEQEEVRYKDVEGFDF